MEGVGYVNGGIYTAIIIMIITVIAIALSKETFGKDLNYVEH
jgi:hypothetical protein